MNHADVTDLPDFFFCYKYGWVVLSQWGDDLKKEKQHSCLPEKSLFEGYYQMAYFHEHRCTRLIEGDWL